jgi:hypothetical protein
MLDLTPYVKAEAGPAQPMSVTSFRRPHQRGLTPVGVVRYSYRLAG